jgi:hypothetical protein
MSTPTSDLANAIAAFNHASIAGAEQLHGLTYHPGDGPVYNLGPIRARTLFTTPDGTHLVDLRLVIESATTDPTTRAALEREHVVNVAASGDCIEMWVYTDVRGRYDAVLVPVDQAAKLLNLPAPAPAQPGWARGWEDFPTISDADHLALEALPPSAL